MKRCPTCRRTYADNELAYCLDDGSLLSAPYNDQITEYMPHPHSGSLPPPRVSSYQPPSSPPVSYPAKQPSSKLGFVKIAGVILVLLLAGIGIVSLIKSQITSSPLITRASEGTAQSATQNPTPIIDLVATHKPRLISAIRLADRAEIEAQQSLDPSPLYNVYQGEALKYELAQIQTLKSRGMFAVSRLENQQFEYFKVSPNAKQAEVRVVETWSSIFYSVSTQQCVSSVPSHDAAQTIFLKYGENGWIVDAINHDNTVSAIEPVPCNN